MRSRGTRTLILLAAIAALTLFAVAAGRWNAARVDAALFRLPAGAPIPEALARAATRRARPVYAAHCASCHGDDLHGDAARGIPNLIDREWIYGTGQPSEIEETILYGIRSGHHRAHDLADMPAFGHARPYRRYVLPSFTRAQIGDLADYVLAIGGHPVARSGDAAMASERAAAERGHQLFFGKGQCYDCHTSDASGDNFAGAPSLIDDVWLYGGSRAAIIATLTNGRAGICPAWAGRLQPIEIRALAIMIAHAAQAAASSPKAAQAAASSPKTAQAAASSPKAAQAAASSPTPPEHAAT